MKLYMEPVEVRADELGRPTVITWRRNRYEVTEVQEKWLFVGKWWITPDLKGVRRRYYRVTTLSPGGATAVMIVFEEAGVWTLSQLAD